MARTQPPAGVRTGGGWLAATASQPQLPQAAVRPAG